MDSSEQSRLNSSEPQGFMMGSNPYGGGVSSSSMPMLMSNPGGLMSHHSFNPISSSAPKTMDTPISLYQLDGGQSVRQGGGLNTGETTKKKRGRPRKYGPDGSMALVLSPPPSGYSNNSMSESSTGKRSMSESSTGKRRGRPPGSGKKQQLDALGSAGIAFTPHIITVKTGEDVASKVVSFSHQGPRSVCILSANGTICNATVRQPSTSSGTVTYEGRFEIISLSGSYLFTTDEDGNRTRTGGLSVTLAGSDGRVVGGVLAGMLMAATPVQVVVGSFIADGKKQKPKPKPEPVEREVPKQLPGFGPALASGPLSPESSSEELDDPPTNQSGGNYDSSAHQVQSLPSYLGWPPSLNHHRHDLT